MRKRRLSLRRCGVRLKRSPPRCLLRSHPSEPHTARTAPKKHNITQTHTLTQNKQQKQQKHVNYFLSYFINPPSQLLGSSYPHPSPDTQFKHPLSSLLPATTTKINNFWSYTPKPGAPQMDEVSGRAGLPGVRSSVTVAPPLAAPARIFCPYLCRAAPPHGP